MIRISTKTAANRSFVDTSGWYAYIVPDERRHAISLNYIQGIFVSRRGLITSDYVVDETLTRLRYDVSHAVALQFLTRIEQMRDSRILQILPIDSDCWNDALAIFTKYDDVAFSFTDCTSFVLCQRMEIREVFAFDAHFAMFGLDLRPAL